MNQQEKRLSKFESSIFDIIDSWKFDFSAGGGYMQVGENTYISNLHEYIKELISSKFSTYQSELIQKVERMKCAEQGLAVGPNRVHNQALENVVSLIKSNN